MITSVNVHRDSRVSVVTVISTNAAQIRVIMEHPALTLLMDSCAIVQLAVQVRL